MPRVFPEAATRVLCGLMPDLRQAPKQGTSIDPSMRVTLVAFFVFCTAVIALVLGLGWKGLLHWTGELLLIIGISLAAKGISDVRREWTGRPGIWTRAQQITQLARARAASFLWLRWNRAVEKSPRLAKWLRMRIHPTHRQSADAMAFAEVAEGRAIVPPVQVVVAESLTVEERLDKLESLMKEAKQQIAILNAGHEQEVKVRQAAMDQEQATRIAEDQSTRDSIANLAGGGLRLQAWGVVCLLAGSIMTAIW